MTLASRFMGQALKLPHATSRSVDVQRDLRVPMPDGAVLLTDRYAPRIRPWPLRPSAAAGAGPLPLRAAPDVGAAVRPAARRAGLPGRDPKLPRHLRLGRHVRPVRGRRARRRPGHGRLAAEAAVVPGLVRHLRAQLPGHDPVGDRGGRGPRPRRDRHPGHHGRFPRAVLPRRVVLAGDRDGLDLPGRGPGTAAGDAAGPACRAAQAPAAEPPAAARPGPAGHRPYRAVLAGLAGPRRAGGRVLEGPQLRRDARRGDRPGQHGRRVARHLPAAAAS